MTAADGKQRLTDVADTEQLLRLIQSIPSPKAEPFKLWLARVGYERLEEIENPELAAKRRLKSLRPRPSQIGSEIIRAVVPNLAALCQHGLKLYTAHPRHLGCPSQRNKPRFVVVRSQVGLHPRSHGLLRSPKLGGNVIWDGDEENHVNTSREVPHLKCPQLKGGRASRRRRMHRMQSVSRIFQCFNGATPVTQRLILRLSWRSVNAL